MSNAALAFLAGLGNGYMNQWRYQDEQDRLNKIDQRAQEEHDARMAELQVKTRGDKALQDAAKPVTVDNNAATVTGVAAKPTVYDNADVAASDVRQANRMAAGDTPMQQNADGTPINPTQAAAAAPVASATPTIAVAGKAFPDQASAQSAADAANTPQAIRGRQIAALNGIDPERALKLEAASTQVDQATQAAADAAWRRKVAGAMLNGGHQGLADLVSNSEHGPMAGVKLQAVPSADGKTVTYNKVEPDGTLTPTGLTFSNDGDGLARAAAALDGAISPADRVKMAQDDEKNALAAKKTGAEITELNARAGYYNAFANERQAKADGTGTDKPYKLDEDDRLRLTNSAKSVSDAQKQVQDALGKLMPGDDPAKNPAVVFAQRNLQAAKLEHLRTNIELGQIPASSMATQILGAARSPQEALQSLSQLGGVVGPKYTDQVAAEIQNSDQWTQWAGKKGAPAPKNTGGPVAARVGVPAAQPAATAPAGSPAASPAPTPPASPPTVLPQAPEQARATQEVGKRLDVARQALQTLLANRPPVTQGREALDAYGDQVRAAQEDVDRLSQQYQSLVQSSVPAFVGYRGVRPRPAAAAGMTAGR